MKVLVLSHATYADPATRKVWDRVAERGFEVTLALPRRIIHPFGPALVPDTPWPTPGVRLVKLDTWYIHENATHVILRGLPRLIRQTQPDIIHCVMEPWSIACLEALACTALRRRRPKFGVQSGETKPQQGGLLARSIRTALYRAVISRSDYFIGWSRLVIQAASRLGLNAQPSTVAPAVGVDTDLFRPAAPGEKQRIRQTMDLCGEGDFLVGFVGRFVKEKGVMDLVAAAERALPSVPNLRLALLGAGPLRDAMISAAVERPWLKLVEPMAQTGVAQFMRSLDLLALPSRTTRNGEEQFGLVLTEAMASGVPSVGSSSGAIPQVVGESGWVFPEGDAEALSRIILSLSTNTQLVAAKGLSARARVLSMASGSAVAESLVDLWRGKVAAEQVQPDSPVARCSDSPRRSVGR